MKLNKNYKMSDKINSHICLMLGAKKVFIKWPNLASKETKYYKI